MQGTQSCKTEKGKRQGKCPRPDPQGEECGRPCCHLDFSQRKRFQTLTSRKENTSELFSVAKFVVP